MGTAALRFGVITQGGCFEGWQVRCLEKLRARAGARLCVWWDLTPPESGRASDGGGLLWRAARGVRSLLRSRARPQEVLALSDAQRIRSRGEVGRGELSRLHAERLDFLLHLGCASLPAEVLGAARDGVWTFRHGGDPAGFWEVQRGEAVTRAALVRLGAVDDRGAELGTELRAATLRTVPWSWLRNRAGVLRECEDWPAEVACELSTGEVRSSQPQCPLSPVRRGRPSDAQLCAHSLRALPRLARELARRFLYVDVWNVGLVESPVHAFLRPGFAPKITWFPSAGSRRLSADPFALWRDGRLCVLYESLEFARGKGFLVAREVGADGFGPERTVMDLPFHLSYPFLLEHGSEVYCIPESFEAGEVSLYRAERFPERWEKAATLIEGFAGIDSTLVRWNERWWCFTTEKGDAHASKLKLFHAQDVRGPWTAHRRTPAKIDVRSARCAGTPFLHAGELYRPAQDYSLKVEGRITINRVVVLTPDRFEEEIVATVGPFPEEPFPDKFHTLCAAGDWTLVDGCKEVCILRAPRLLLFQLKRALSALRRKPVVPGRASGASAARD